MSAFEALGVVPSIIQAVEEMDWLLPTDVQDEAIPLILGGGDVLVAAETGSGKTGAFAIPMLQAIHESLRGEADVSDTKKSSADGKDAKVRVVMNGSDRDMNVAISPDGLTVQSRDEKGWGGARANCGFFRGRYYFEATVSDEGLCRIGWSTRDATYDIGTDGWSYGYGGTGKKSHNKSFDEYGGVYGLNDVIGCYLDLESGQISYAKNGKDLGPAFSIPKNVKGECWYPAVVLKNAEMKFNFGGSAAAPLKYPLRYGYQACAAAAWADTSFAKPPAADQKVKNNGGSAPLGLIIEPTRDLAIQVDGELTKFKKYLTAPEIAHQLVTGDNDTKQMMQALRAGVHIIVATPGQLMNLIKSNKIDLSQIRCFVMDEADSLLQQGSKDDLMTIYAKLPKQRSMQIVVCSATLHSPEIKEFTEKVCNNPTWVDLKGKDSVPETVDHAVMIVDPKQDKSWTTPDTRLQTDGVHANDKCGAGLETAECLSEATKRLKHSALLKLIDAFKMDQCIIFARTQLDCDNVEDFLAKVGGGRKWEGKQESGKENPYSCVVLHGGRKQAERTANLDAFREGEVRFLICTDVAARGIDIKGLPYVINLTLPDKSETYIHRIGRVGRAECAGLALSIVGSAREKQWYHTCQRADRGRGCKRTNTTDQGGCTIWFDEVAMLSECEKRIGKAVDRLDPADLLKGKEKVIAMQQKLRASGSADDQIMKQHVAIVMPVAEQLFSLEAAAQANFIASAFDPNKWKALLK